MKLFDDIPINVSYSVLSCTRVTSSAFFNKHANVKTTYFPVRFHQFPYRPNEQSLFLSLSDFF